MKNLINKNFKKHLFCFLLIIKSFYFCFGESEPVLTQEIFYPEQQNFFINIRILLQEQNSLPKDTFSIESDAGFILIADPQNSKKQITKDTKKFEIIVRKNQLYLAEPDVRPRKILSHEICLVPLKNSLKLNKQKYQGKISFVVDDVKNTVYIINSLKLEDYLYSVLASEIYPTWPLEMQKTQAIVSRSYAIHCIINSRTNTKNKLPYDIKNTNFHQTYTGLHNFTHLRKAVEETKNLILTYNNKVILAMFDSCCGGIIPAYMKSVNNLLTPYLARKTPCHYCKNFKLYSWHNDISIQRFLDKLKENKTLEEKLKNCGKLTDILLVNKDKAGIVLRIRLVFTKKNVNLTGKELAHNLKDYIKSLNFKIKKVNNRVVIDGKGYGHQTGLCQHGAKTLADQGWNFRKILKFYYPKTTFAKLVYNAKT